MKVFVVLSALAAVAFAGNYPAAVAPLAYSGLYNPLAYSYGYAAPAVAAPAAYAYSAPAYAAYAAAPAVTTYAAAPVAVAPVATKTQYHAQDELGQASYGYAHPGQVHNAVRDAFGNVAGSYSYVDPNGKVVKTDYIADAAGFRVASNALPEAPVAPAVAPVALPVGPAPVQDTVEVAAARAAHLAEHAAVKSRARRAILPYAAYPYAGYAYGAPALTTYAAHVASPLAYSAAHIAAPLAYSAAPAVVAAPAVRAATLTTVVNTPGHAVSYRVD
ncbi:cuticle protein 19.8-like [Neocloeon triangulifer]|uniref:cuticle protein 19.8-like n=1 Tax=Neocloeon triangulifer TaxID=2078957 RepID=UPI00286F3500|nr:cuticle protein 19.8-like [Neocloeon triangulifer]